MKTKTKMICPLCGRTSCRAGTRIKVSVDDVIPRRIRLDKNTKAELAIRNAINEVETVGAHQKLTEAVILLGHALEKVADFTDAPRRCRQTVQ